MQTHSTGEESSFLKIQRKALLSWVIIPILQIRKLEFLPGTRGRKTNGWQKGENSVSGLCSPAHGSLPYCRHHGMMSSIEKSTLYEENWLSLEISSSLFFLCRELPAECIYPGCFETGSGYGLGQLKLPRWQPVPTGT